MLSDLNLANAIRFLSMDAVQQANSGHPGMPMGMADIATILWRENLNHNPGNPKWPNRDRFILSNGHGCMLHYALLHLSGYELTLDDIKNFRQLHSKTPGHPEYGHTPGIETTTGPLGQGIATGVGMAMAEKMLAAEFNTSDHNIVDHNTFVFAGDGCLMEGISHEACSLAGTLGLGKLTVIYDDNNISIDGEVSGWFTDNTPARFRAYDWHVIEAVDGHDHEQIRDALHQARNESERPTIVCCKTHIGFGAPNKVDSARAHGAPLGEEEIALTRKALNWEHPPFHIPEDIYAAWNYQSQGQTLEQQWDKRFSHYESTHPKQAKEFLRRINGYLPENFTETMQEFITNTQATQKPTATRKASLTCINTLVAELPELVGGSADLSGSNCTEWTEATTLSKNDFSARYIKYGVREFAMSAITNGLALHGGFIPFSGTFLVFSDYARNAIRLSALMQQKVIYVYTHDSIGLGEDGPTHQPIEHASILRLTPNLNVWRPADTTETAVSWQHAIEYQGPSALLLSRQNCPAYARSSEQLNNIARGGYILSKETGECQGIIMATGSEVDIAIQAQQQLQQHGMSVRVVSLPCVDVFLQQDLNYQNHVLPPQVSQRIAIEAGASALWHQLTGTQGKVMGIDQFGYSAPYKEVYAKCKLTVEHAVAHMQNLISSKVPS